MKTVRQLLEAKGGTIVSISPNASMSDAMQMMLDKNIGALLVLDAENVLVGIVSERDCVKRMATPGPLTRNILVSELMTTKVLYVRPDQTNEECMALITEKRIRHLPVLENNCVIGILSIGDMVKDTIAEKDFLIDQLINYICR
ncbi:MAG: CBS domain-containing protein [Betaproteobacteria bacterium]|nr:CBS domain-containing protein [Betaproteobacteria bacterium]